MIKLAPGANAAQVQSRLKTVMEKAFPTADVLNQQELKDSQESQVNQLLGLIYALLSLAVIISLFGIANTLALSIHERTRELGHAAGGRHVAPPGEEADPLRVGDHRPDRRRARPDPRHDLRGPDVSARWPTRASA